METSRTPRRPGGLRIVTEPGLPATIVEHADRRIRRVLDENEVGFRGFTVTEEAALHASPQGDLEAGWAGRAEDETDAVIFVTELPRAQGRDVLTVELDHDRRAAVICAPALGLFPGHALVRCVEQVLRRLSGGHGDDSGPAGGRWRSAGDGTTEYLVAAGPLSRLRLVVGMIRGNRPWRMIPTLTGMTAAAAATASFGVFYSSIWSMANALSPWRLGLITLLSVALASIWLIVNNRLWEGPGAMPRWRRRLYNTATLGTVGFSAVVLYVGLFVATLVAAVVVIESQYMAEQLGHPVGFRDYAYLAWLATSMGMVAGGLGSSADSYDDVLRATYGYRERMRRRRIDEAERREEDDARDG
ncbi:hypothetical protein VZC37_21410 [Gordonia sp. LSe1-13]|uniref:Uncharacterized protein n=1 Tax=Gordonia sesuvii TaxID=3116777 RepID=A0ABU7MIH7_9ACTN|nr:hypothetical protein [Gordonia sp. LSe1-13]